MEIAFILSLEHETLPESELEAVLKAEEIPYAFKQKYNGFITTEIPDKYIKNSFYAFLSSMGRLSLTHEVFELLISTDAGELLDKVK